MHYSMLLLCTSPFVHIFIIPFAWRGWMYVTKTGTCMRDHMKCNAMQKCILVF